MSDTKGYDPIRLGMVGGGQGAFIGNIHRMAARLDGQFTLVAGALSSDADRARQSGATLGLDPSRCYSDYREMAQQEAARPDGIQAVSIVTPNHLHLPVAAAFLDAGIHVICDKPLTNDLATAQEFASKYQDAKTLFILTHNYVGAPMIQQARDMVTNGAIGKLRHVQAEYLQDWLTEPADAGNKQAAWRTDPNIGGVAGALGDIGSHAYHLTCFVTGERATALAADATAFVDGRQVNDNASVLLRFGSGAKGMLWVSQVAVGNENGLSLRIYGDKGGLEWRQEEPDRLWYTPYGQPKQLLTRGGAGAGVAANAVTRLPAGHSEGYVESFANIYCAAANAIRARRDSLNPTKEPMLTDLSESLHGMKFINACINSSQMNAVWQDI